MKLWILSLAAASSLFGADITGTWYFAVELSIGSGSPTFVLKQEGEKVTGTYSGTLGEAPVTGTVNGDKVEISFESNAAGEKVKVVYSGTVKNAKEMGGKVIYGELGEGTWTAKKKE